MDTSVLIAYIIVIIFLVKLVMGVNWYGSSKCEGLVSRPAHKKREQMTDVVMNNKDIFTNDQMRVSYIRSVIPWIDVIVVEDLRKLIRENKFDKKNIYQVLG
jgi:hypothetical protein